MRLAASSMASSVLRSPFGFWAVTLEGRCLHQDRGKRIPQVMSHDAEHLITELGGMDRSPVQTCILDCDSRSLRQRLSQTKIAPSISARLCGGDKCKYAEEPSLPQERHRHQRCRIHCAQCLQVLRPLGSGFKMLRGDVFDKERLFRVKHGSEEMRAISIDHHCSRRAQRSALDGSAATIFRRLICSRSSMISTRHQSAKSRTTR